ncbi:glycoside hydrolase family 2 protein [Thalassotalea sp. PLHSN55]|uniref:glycoside hydrolase family 2 protein n=1 Tax=Thalassotalea sp. PLHSN55 TaxID=3435888 RepID=UPI003F85D9C3
MSNKIFLARQLMMLLAISFISVFATFIKASEPAENAVQPLSTIATQTQSLAGQWSFKIDPRNVGDDEKWWQQHLNIQQWDKIKVPGVWDVYDRYHDYTGTAWYRYTFEAKHKEGLNNIQLNFDSVYHDSEVWLNGEKLGENNLGFMAFKFDVSDRLNKAAFNTLVVKVNNRVKRGAVWNWGGIRFPVYLTYKPATHLDRVYVAAQPDLDAGTADLHIRTTINGNKVTLEKAQLALNISRLGQPIYNKIISTKHIKATKDEQLSLTHQLRLNKQDVALWHFNHPALYDIQATLIVDNTEHHQINDRFGIRKIETKNNALYLNGEKIRLNGLNMVPEDRFDGNALPLSRIKEDVDLLKTLNGNFARLSGPALPNAYLDYLDEIGFLLIEEVGLWGKDKQVDPNHPVPKEWLKRLVNDHYNHPSIIGWSVGNEIGDLKKNPKALEYVEGAIAHSRELDPNRLAVYISYSADYQKDDPSMFSDIIMFNKYSDHEERLKVVHDFHPDKAVFFSEIGTELDGVDPNDSTLEPVTLWNGLKKYPYLIGTSHFAFSDYRSDWKDKNPAKTTDLSENRAWGVLTAYRTPKRSFEKLKNYNAPIESLTLTKKNYQTFALAIEPKSKDTFPAFIMKNYQVVWMARNHLGEITAANTIPLPTIKPGDEQLTFDIQVEKPFEKLSAYLLDPFGYNVKQVDSFLSTPKAPVINTISTSLDIIRVTYDKSALAQEYQLIAIEDTGKEILGKPTINDFAQVTNLEGDKEYTLVLKAINDVGESTENQRVKVRTTPAELPPTIWSVEAKEDAFHIGFSVHLKDFKYEIQYGLTSKDYSKQFLIDTHGATRIPAIKAGQDHYFRLRRLITGRPDSEWTKEYKVIMPTKSGLRAPNDAKIITSDKGVILHLSPIAGATNYRLKWQQNNQTKTIDTNLAYSSFVVLNNKVLQSAKHIEIATINNEGKVGPYTKLSKLAN